MNDQIKKAFSATFVQLIISGRYTIEDVPEGILNIVKEDLGAIETKLEK
ncbi:MAG: CD1375 family protein [Bacillota bacterium]